MRTHLLSVLIINLLCHVAVVNAASAPAFAELLKLAERSGPRLLQANAEVAAAQGRAQQAQTRANPVLGLAVEDVAGSGTYRGSNQAQTTLSLAYPLELAGQRPARMAAGRAELGVAQSRQQQDRIEFAYELALAYATAEANQARVKLLDADLERAREDMRSAKALVAAGREPELRQLLAEAAATTAQSALDTGNAENTAAFAELSSLAGTAEPYSEITVSMLNATAAVAQVVSTTQANAPVIATAQAEHEAAKRRLTVVEKQRIPAPAVSLGVRHLASSGDNALVAEISFPLPLFDRNRGNIAAAAAELNAAEAGVTRARLETDAAQRAATARLQAAASNVAAAEQTTTASAEAYRLARIGYDAGRISLMELLSIRRGLVDAQLHAVEAKLNQLGAAAVLARLNGRILLTE